MKHDDIPILRGVITGTIRRSTSRIIEVYCPYCDKFHIHGFAAEGTKKEHRSAHCVSSDSPFKRSGYYIAPFKKKDLQRLKINP